MTSRFNNEWLKSLPGMGCQQCGWRGTGQGIFLWRLRDGTYVCGSCHSAALTTEATLFALEKAVVGDEP